MKVHFITFANTDSNFSQERIIYEAERTKIFDSIKFYTEKDFDDEFMSRCGEYFKTYKRGYGYWSWKPYIIRKELQKMNDGDVVVYADSGCMFVQKNRKILRDWIKRVHNAESGVLSPCYGPYIEHDWTRGDLYQYINEKYNKDNVDIFDKAVQCGCGISLYCKKAKCVDFVNQWYDVMTNHFHLCTDEPSQKPNHPNFRENRHDQSVFSMLSKIYKIETIETQTGILDKNYSPIIASRCKNDKHTWKRPVRILFDHQIYNLQEFGGISRMYADIAESLNRNEIIERYTGSGVANGKYQEYAVDFSIGNTNNSYLRNEYCDTECGENRPISIKTLQEGNFDIFFPSFYMTYWMKYIGNKPFVMSVHDMIPEIYEEFFSRSDIMITGKKEMVKSASAIEVPTECTKKDLIRILGVDPNKIHVVGRAIKPDFGRLCYASSIVKKPYILYVGQRNAYKRFDWFIKHIVPFMNEHKDMIIICTGKKFSPVEEKMFEDYGLKGRIYAVFVDDITMASLYKFAEFFVFSSEYEGFGLPVLEAAKMGCITLLNNTECFREVTDNKGIYFNLTDKESNLSEVAERVFSMSQEEKQAERQKQYQLLKKYSFENYIDNFKKMFNSVIQNNGKQ